MKISDIIQKLLPHRTSIVYDTNTQGIFGTWFAERRPYGDLIWYNLCGVLLDLSEDVKLTLDPVQSGDGDKLYTFAAYRTFYYAWGRTVFQKLKDNGYVVIGWDGSRFWLMSEKEYDKPTDGEITYVKPRRSDVQAYVMRDPMFVVTGKSTRCLCRSWLDFLDDVCNGSATVSNRLGAVVIGSPKTPAGAPTPNVLTDEQKKQYEEDWQKTYGSLRAQRQFMMLPKEMSFQVVNLSGLDLKFDTKVRNCVLAIADSIPVPANQIALIDANSSKSLSNGSELREGDKAKYKTFRRLFERTFVMMALDLGLKVEYQIDGEPVDNEVNAEGA